MESTVSTNNAWFPSRRRRTPQARARLFCFPYAGGGASLFRAWSELAPPELDICPVQLPGRENRLNDPPISRLSLLVDTLIPVLIPHLEIPYAFFGHSMGALISFELARNLRRVTPDTAPLALFVSGHRSPQLPDLQPPIYHLPHAAFLEQLRHLQGTPEEVLQNEELLHLLMPLLRADFTLCETYTYRQEPPLSCSIFAFGGLQDTEVPTEEITAWREQTSAFFQQRFFPGGHFFLRKEQVTLLHLITQDLFHLLENIS